VLKQNEEECFFQEFNPADLQGVIDKQQKLIESLKERGARTLPNILIVLDDIADNEQIARREVLLHQLFFRGRHAKDQHADRHAKVQSAGSADTDAGSELLRVQAAQSAGASNTLRGGDCRMLLVQYCLRIKRTGDYQELKLRASMLKTFYGIKRQFKNQ
jgi:hypothetical protein